LYKHQHNTQNKQYKQYKEQIILNTPKDQVRDKLEEIKNEQNRKFSLLYEHYKSNVEAVYQQQNLKLTNSQQLEQDKLNEDLENQLNVLKHSHELRKRQQLDMFRKESAELEAERLLHHRQELTNKINKENKELEEVSQQRINKLIEIQQQQIEEFDADCTAKYNSIINQMTFPTPTINTPTNSNNNSAPNYRHSIYNMNPSGINPKSILENNTNSLNHPSSKTNSNNNNGSQITTSSPSSTTSSSSSSSHRLDFRPGIKNIFNSSSQSSQK
jgi:hypothetical protein